MTDVQPAQPYQPVKPETDVFFQFSSEDKRNEAIEALRRRESDVEVAPTWSLTVKNGAAKKASVTGIVKSVDPSAERMRHDT